MLKWTLAAAVVTVLAAIVITWEADSCETQNQESQTAATAEPLPNPMPVVPGGHNSDTNKEHRQNQTGRTANGSDSYFCRVVTPANLPTVFLVLIGFGGIVVAIGTLEILEKQIEAALFNAKAVIDTERPWLVVSVEKNEAIGRPGFFFFRVTNRGRTPAQLISGGMALDFKTNANFLPVPPNYEPFFLPNNTFLPPGDYFDIRRTQAEADIGTEPAKIFAEHFKGTGATYSGDILFFFGNLVYDDVLGKGRPKYAPHETRWCFAFFKAGLRFVRTGPNGEPYRQYNGYT